jgi:hypothetical protein
VNIGHEAEMIAVVYNAAYASQYSSALRAVIEVMEYCCGIRSRSEMDLEAFDSAVNAKTASSQSGVAGSACAQPA